MGAPKSIENDFKVNENINVNNAIQFLIVWFQTLLNDEDQAGNECLKKSFLVDMHTYNKQ